MSEEQKKYYGTITELQEIRKTIKYLAKVMETMQEQLERLQPQKTEITNFNQVITPKVEQAILSIAQKSEKPITNEDKLRQELNFYRREYRWAKYIGKEEKAEIYRETIINTQKELNNLYNG